MGKRKDRARAKHHIFRNGKPISVSELKKAEEDKKLQSIGLVRGKPNILTPDQLWKERRPIK